MTLRRTEEPFYSQERIKEEPGLPCHEDREEQSSRKFAT
jgi:hypothetical protein